MEIWSKCDICGRDIPVGELCYGLKKGNCICKYCCTGFENCTFTLAPAPTLTPPNEWVSVEDEIPSDDDDGLEFFCMTNATGKGGGVLPMEWEVVTIRGKTVRRWKWLNRISPWAVTHWMKRPAPPDRRPPEGEEDT